MRLSSNRSTNQNARVIQFIIYNLIFITGTFARIYNGVLTGPGEAQQQSVLVKTVSGMASEDQINLLLIESSMLKDLTHKNLLPVMAVCLEDEKQPLIMFPFMNRGNLKLYIKKSRSPEGGSKVSSAMFVSR